MQGIYFTTNYRGLSPRDVGILRSHGPKSNLKTFVTSSLENKLKRKERERNHVLPSTEEFDDCVFDRDIFPPASKACISASRPVKLFELGDRGIGEGRRLGV